ncbi:hypothetical protein Tco_0901464 [Tanacetum coccineum]
MPSIWCIKRLCNKKFAFVVLLFHVGCNFVTLTQLDCIMGNTPYGPTKAWYLDDGNIVGDTLVVGKVLDLIMEDGPPSEPAFEDALCDFNVKMKIDLLSNPSEIVAPKLMKKLTDIYFSRVTQTTKSTFSLSTRQMALWKSQMEDHTFDWLRMVSISWLGQTMNGGTYRVFGGDIYGDHAVLCAGIVGIKNRHNIVRDTFVDICFRSGISAGKEVDIRLSDGHDKTLHLADMLLYSWDGGLDVCVDLTGSSPLTQTGMVDFALGRAMIDAQILDMVFSPSHSLLLGN